MVDELEKRGVPISRWREATASKSEICLFWWAVGPYKTTLRVIPIFLWANGPQKIWDF
jgi:hypothetical protein